MLKFFYSFELIFTAFLIYFLTSYYFYTLFFFKIFEELFILFSVFLWTELFLMLVELNFLERTFYYYSLEIISCTEDLSVISGDAISLLFIVSDKLDFYYSGSLF